MKMPRCSRLFQSMAGDLVFAFRQLARSPLFTAAVLITRRREARARTREPTRDGISGCAR